jgi:signal transduction histidine kinase
MQLDRHLAEGQGSSDWTADPQPAGRARELPRRGQSTASNQAASSNTERPTSSVPVDRRSPTAPRDRRHPAAVPVHDLRASEALRPFFGISFIAIIITAMLLMLCYRYFTIQAVIEQTGATNAVAADAAAAANHEQIADFLARRQVDPSVPLPDAIATPLHELVKDTPVERVRIINARREVVFSTSPGARAESPTETKVVSEALAGAQNSTINYRDLFNSFAYASNVEEDNMVLTGLPLQQQHQGATLGVFEIKTDVGPLVKHHQQAQLLIAGTATLLMLVLYGSLMATIRRIGRVIDIQQDALRQRSDLLAELSTDMMNIQEEEKQRIAAELHERVAQTLAAVKLNIESTSVDVRRSDTQAASMLQSLLTPVHDAIQEVRATASGLRPSSLDDLGLLPTLKWLWRELAGKRPDIELDYDLLVSEGDVPAALRPMVFRAAEDACASLRGNPSVRRAAFLLSTEDDQLILRVRDDASSNVAETDPRHPYARVRERALLSSGEFSSRTNSWGGLAVKASWSL